MTESSSENKVLVLRLGELCKPLAAGHSYTIGCDAECDLTLSHGSVGHVHCRLEVRENDILVHDLNSAMGIKVEGVRGMDLSWTPGQILEIGEIRVELELTAPMLTMKEIASQASKLAVVHHAKEQEFGEIMLTELKRAPWVLISAFVHAALLLLLWVFMQEPPPPGPDSLTLSLELTEAEDAVEEDTAEEENVEESEEMEDIEFTETELQEAEEQEIYKEEAAIYETGFGDYGDLTSIKGSGSGLGDILKAAKGTLSGSFTKAIRERRKSGLEIVFVFDSTGSMGSVLLAAKERIAKMVEVLQELVPHARIGIITYRDDDDTEAYTTRDVVLSRDFYRAMNFLKGVYAGGGGDIPEAVYQALYKATSQKWSKSSRRLIVLIGDAPPHKKTEGRISSMVKNFSRNGRSHVHAIVTRPSSEDKVSKEATRTFKRIARDGRGDSLTFENESGILRAVMTLAFGRTERRSLQKIYEMAEKRSNRYSKESQRIVAEHDLRKLRREFKKKVISHDLVKAILHKPNKEILKELVEVSRKSSTPNPGRHAASFILERTLHLDEPPVDPETCKSISSGRAKRFHRYIDRNFK